MKGVFCFRRFYLIGRIRLRLESKGRAGKVVAILEGFTHCRSCLEKLTSRLKHSCGRGGVLKDRRIEIQADFRNQIRAFLLKERFGMKG